jgi:multidrug efflux pump subunit AcrA (membrane-fusion protein)
MSTTEEKILKKEDAILTEETAILKEVRSERKLFMIGYGVLTVIVLTVGGLTYFKWSSGRIQIDKSKISAPLIQLGDATPGTLQEIFVHDGDTIPANAVVARVDNQTIKTKVAGLVVATQNDIGKRFNPGEAIVTMIEPDQLRVVGSIEEDKGLQDVRVGQAVTFTIDTFGSKQFTGTVDEISPTSNESGIVFNISDKREVKEFDIKVRFNISDYPELKNGMSAKMTILK